MGTTQAPLLDGDCKAARRSFMQRLAGFQGPSSAVTLLAFMTLATFAGLMDCSIRRSGARGSGGAVSLVAMPDSVVVPTGATVATPDMGAAALAAVAACLAVLLLGHVLSEKLVMHAIAKEVGGGLAPPAGVGIERGRMQVWPLAGRLEWRNCLVKNPSGYAGDHLAQVRSITADVAVMKFVLSCGRDVEISSLRVDGVSVVAQAKHGKDVKDESNIQEAVDAMLQATAHSDGSVVRIGRARVTCIDVFVVGAGERHDIPDFEVEGLSAGGPSATRAAGATAAALAAKVGEAVLAGL